MCVCMVFAVINFKTVGIKKKALTAIETRSRFLFLASKSNHKPLVYLLYLSLICPNYFNLETCVRKSFIHSKNRSDFLQQETKNVYIKLG